MPAPVARDIIEAIRARRIVVDPLGHWGQTAAELAAGVTPVAYNYEPGDVRRYGAVGDNVTDSTAAINNAILSMFTLGGGDVKIPSGTWLISTPILLKKGVRLIGEGLIRPDSLSSASIIFLKAAANCSMLQTPYAASGNSADIVLYMGVEDLVFEGNRDNQTRAAEFTAVDFRGALFPSYLKRVFIKNVYGPGLRTGDDGSDLVLEDVWIYQCATDNYAWAQNIGFANTNGAMYLRGVFVEYTSKATGWTIGEGVTALRATPNRRGKGILLRKCNRVQYSILSVEAAEPGITVDGGELVDLGHVNGSYIGDDTTATVVKIISAVATIQASSIRGRNMSAGTLKIVEASGAGVMYPDVDWVLATPVVQNYRAQSTSVAFGVDTLGNTWQSGKWANKRTSVSAAGAYALLSTDVLIDCNAAAVTSVTLPAVTGTSGTRDDSREVIIINRTGAALPINPNGAELFYPGGLASLSLGNNECIVLVSVPNIGWIYLGAKRNNVSADKGDAAATLSANSSPITNIWNTPLTVNRAVTLSTTDAYDGARFRIVRTANATGAFNLNVGTGPLKALAAAGSWCDVVYNGVTAAWMLDANGAL